MNDIQTAANKNPGIVQTRPVTFMEFMLDLMRWGSSVTPSMPQSSKDTEGVSTPPPPKKRNRRKPKRSR